MNPRAFGAVVFLYLLAITVLRDSPYSMFGTIYGMRTALLMAALPLLAAAMAGTPRALALAVFVASLGPMHTISSAVVLLGMVWLLIRALLRRGEDWRMHWSRLRHGATGALLVFIAYLLLLWLLRLGDSTDMYSFPIFFTGWLAVPLWIALLGMMPFTPEDIAWLRTRVLLAAAALAAVILVFPLLAGAPQLYLSVLQPLLRVYPDLLGIDTPKFPLPDMQQPYDFNWGSLASAHYSSMLLAVLGVGLLIHAASMRSPRWLPLSIATLAASLMGENLHAVPGLLTGAVLASAALTLASRQRMNPPVLAGVTLVVLGVGTAALIGTLYSGGGPYADTRKAVLIHNSLDAVVNKPFRALFGEGPGTHGSKAADMRLPLRYREMDSNLPERMNTVNPRYAAVLDKVSTVPQFIPPYRVQRSSTMGRTMSGSIAAVREFGIMGFGLAAIVLYLLLRNLYRECATGSVVDRSWAAAALLLLATVCMTALFRHYVEYPDIMISCGMLLLLAKSPASSASEAG